MSTLSRLASLLLLTALVPVGHAAYPDDLRLMTHNVYMLSTNLYPNWGQNYRAGLIASADYIKNQDVVILNEAFDNAASVTLLNGLASQYPYQTPVLGRSQSGWDATLGSYTSSSPEDGGVAIVSKWPIEEKVQFVYSAACGADALSNKGFVYVRVNRNGLPYHIIGTHAQAQDSACTNGQAESVRAQQFAEIRNFIAGKGIPANEAVYIGGDLNVIRDSSEYASMLNNLQVHAPTAYAGVNYTWDPLNNGIANYNYPDAGREYLDYILVSRNHAQPSLWHNQAIDIPSSSWEITSGGRTYRFKDYSDHYPVTAFARANATTPVQSYKSLVNRYGNVTIESLGNGKAVRAGGSATAYITATGSTNDAAAGWNLRNSFYPVTSCINNGDYIEMESRQFSGYWLNWYLNAFSGGNYAYYPKQGDSSDRLRLLNLSRGVNECLQDGDIVALRDRNTANGKDYYLKRWPSGSWVNHIYLWSSSIGTDEKFRVRINSTQMLQDFSPYLQY
ncbi:MAG: sphingomyelin phosphodiesterase [Moraxellaceae bacterium]|nr:sphingomyelin phosphodiesterase [Moraxellaceae bacterium]